MKIERASDVGLCFGIKRALSIIESVAGEKVDIETLGPVAHNQHVLRRLADKGVRAAKDIDDIKGHTVVISSHGIGPELEEELRRRNLNIVDTTCPFVHRAQLAARRLASSGFTVVIYGDANHTEVKGILGWAGDKGIATLDAESIVKLRPMPRRLGILSQTTQIPANFTIFVKKLIDSALTKDSEFRIVDTICHSTRERQAAALRLAGKTDLMLVIGSSTSANTNRLVELCSGVTETYLIESADDVQPSQLRGHRHVGITAGASTPEETINLVEAQLKQMAQKLDTKEKRTRERK